MKKKKSNQKAVLSSFSLREDEPFDTFKAQLLSKVSAKISLQEEDYSHFEVAATALRIISKPGLVLDDEDQFVEFLKKVKTMKSNEPMVNLSIVQTKDCSSRPPRGSKSESPDGSPSPSPKKSSKKKDKKKEKGPLPGNVERAKCIQELQERWVCKKRTPECIGSYCYVFIDADGIRRHLPMNDARFECWGSAMVIVSGLSVNSSSCCVWQEANFNKSKRTGDGVVTADTPPRHHLFELPRLPKVSPVVQQRADKRAAEAAAAAASSSTASDGSNSLAAERDLLLLGILSSMQQNQQVLNAQTRLPLVDMAMNGYATPRIPPTPASTPVPAATTSGHAVASSSYIKLLGPGFLPGPDMTIDQFAQTFELSQTTVDKLQAHRYTKARTLRFVEDKDLIDMGFVSGERAEFVDALEQWSNASASAN
ncbi:hypothetical protein NMY22_g4576 [Coprinellus aureogranulatus]|nr:hypothetical protein NMY22_g4576 [Coprinellus aureogranulatus]